MRAETSRSARLQNTLSGGAIHAGHYMEQLTACRGMLIEILEEALPGKEQHLALGDRDRVRRAFLVIQKAVHAEVAGAVEQVKRKLAVIGQEDAGFGFPGKDDIQAQGLSPL